jgi:protein CpxP
MHSSLGRVLPAALAAGMTAILIAAAAWSMPHGAGRSHDPQRMIDYLEKQLDLTGEQRAAVQPLLSAMFTAAETDAERLHTLRDTLREHRDVFEAGRAQAAADEIGQITTRMVYRMASTQAQIYQLLNDEQKKLLDKMDKKRKARRDQWRERWIEPFE